VYMKSTLPQLS